MIKSKAEIKLTKDEYGGKKLFVYHRFAGSVPFEEYLKVHGIDTSGLSALAVYGAAD